MPHIKEIAEASEFFMVYFIDHGEYRLTTFYFRMAEAEEEVQRFAEDFPDTIYFRACLTTE